MDEPDSSLPEQSPEFSEGVQVLKAPPIETSPEPGPAEPDQEASETQNLTEPSTSSVSVTDTEKNQSPNGIQNSKLDSAGTKTRSPSGQEEVQLSSEDPAENKDLNCLSGVEESDFEEITTTEVQKAEETSSKGPGSGPSSGPGSGLAVPSDSPKISSAGMEPVPAGLETSALNKQPRSSS